MFFFTCKPSDFYSIWHKSLGDFFPRNRVWLIAKGLGFKNKYNCNVNVKWPKIPWLQCALKLWWQNVFLATNQILCFLHIERRSHSTLHISHYGWNIWSLCWENHSITFSSSSEYLGVKQPRFARFADILSLPERIVAWSFFQHCTTDSQSP